MHERREEKVDDQSDIVDSDDDQNYNDDDQKLPYRPSGNIVTPKQRKKLSKENKFVTPQRQTRKQNKS